nr:uncharacterized protein LOC131794190 [Pocillopora verrucosa]
MANANLTFAVELPLVMMMVIIYSRGTNSALQKCGVSYSKVGCFVDKRRPFRNMLLDQRKNIDWQNWNDFLERFVCACANKTVTDGCAYFGIQFWAECWAGENPDVAYNSDGQSNYCFGHDFLPCARVSSSCAGAKDVNFVYKIEVDQPPDARFKTICPTVVSTITCHNDTKIFIESVMYGRTDNFTCPPTSLCDPSIDLSRKVTPICQGKSSCDINGSYDGLEKPCNTSYFNISYTCKKINVTEIKEHHIGNFVCPKGKVFVAHRLEWLGIEYILKSRNISAPNSTIPLVATSTSNLSMIWSTSKSNRKVLQTQVVASTSLLASGFHISSTALVTQKKTATTPSLFTMMINSSSTSGSESLAASSRPSSPLLNSVMKSPGVSATLSETLITEGSFSSSPLPTTAAPVTTPSLLSSTLLNPVMLPSMTSSPTIATFFPRQSTEVRPTKPSLSLKNSPDKIKHCCQRYQQRRSLTYQCQL